MRQPALLAAVLLAGCIERPWGAAGSPPARTAVDRAHLADVLVPPPPDATAVGAVFGRAAELVAYRVEPRALVPGQPARITLYWKCLAELDAWHVFVHLDAAGTGERLHAEHDPAGGRFPTDAWRPGDFVADTFTFVAPRTPLLLYLGFYSSGENRLALTAPGRGRDDGGDRLFVGLLPVARD